MKTYSTGSWEVRFDAAQSRLHLACSGSFRSEDFRESLLVALDCAEEHHVKQWLIDYTAIGNLDEAEENWLHNHLFPRIMMTMGTGNYVAVILSERCYQTLLSEAGLFGLQSYNSFIIINTFSSTELAVAWLNDSAIPHAS
ncbi:hypothetical protein GCM10023188_28760 [Pontibacter saemangeumensis]|uniref:SpoIIAA-like n=1 Tax=Pontibacter saemangeumensis TaxID=1084525 RepID=A0ABP8LUU0_9BACT